MTRDTLKFGVNAGAIKNSVCKNEKQIIEEKGNSVANNMVNEFVIENNILKGKIDIYN